MSSAIFFKDVSKLMCKKKKLLRILIYLKPELYL